MQGTLNLDCIAADPYSRYLYGVGSANKGSLNNDDGYTDSTIVLVRSNASPTNLAALTWTVIAHVNGKDLSYNYPTFTSVDCAASSDGEVTAYFRSPYQAREDVRAFIRPDTEDFNWIYDSFDYSRQGFFYSNKGRPTSLITYHRNIFFLGGTFPNNATCPDILTASVGTRMDEPCKFQGVLNQGTFTAQHYVFGGDRNGTTFFGGVFEVDDVFKIYTTEQQESRKYIEHTIIRSENSSDYSVDQNWQVVGGLIEGQEPFVVALTSAGLFQFTIFGPAVGTMDGPFKVGIADDFNSLPHRVVTKLKSKMTVLNGATDLEQRRQQEKSRAIIGVTVGGVVLVAVFIGFSLWRRARRRKEDCEKEKEVEAVRITSCMGKYEVHSMGIIPESDIETASTKSKIN
ncbi:hypothetical protein BGZ96_009720 [Linnemannia gamsii]|uniref:Peptidase A1 domain-containing protein n=1 Tax=Linnemannia gamsii TaxID=64522 RepID=A0ABQ7KDA0_9FUNG|nr:hypothetical protein BGZ96_009720 [Linnemannia gamsii]